MTAIEFLDLIGKYAGTGVTTFVAGGLGAYCSSYLKKSAENKAIHENLGKLVQQMSAVTQATKEIEARISIDVWSHQQRWDVQKAALLDSLKALADADTFLWRLVHAFRSTREMEINERNRHRTEAESLTEVHALELEDQQIPVLDFRVLGEYERLERRDVE